jgi:hypothetical protein
MRLPSSNPFSGDPPDAKPSNARLTFSTLIAILLIVAIPLAQAQQVPVSLSAKAEKIRHRVMALSLGSPITVIMKNKAEYHGSLGTVRDTEFVVNEVDENRPVTVRYEDVNKLRKDYGGYNSVSGRHVDPFRSKVTAALVLGGLVALVLVLVSLDKS